jgi:hypothetical protein
VSNPGRFRRYAAAGHQVDRLVYHVEEITIERPLDVVVAEASRTSIERTMRGTATLPGVSGKRTRSERTSQASAAEYPAARLPACRV